MHIGLGVGDGIVAYLAKFFIPRQHDGDHANDVDSRSQLVLSL